jgi:catalase
LTSRSLATHNSAREDPNTNHQTHDASFHQRTDQPDGREAGDGPARRLPDSSRIPTRYVFSLPLWLFKTDISPSPAHSRGILLNGTFTPAPEAASLSKAHHFNAPSTPIIARFSNSTGLPQIPDNAGDANPRGLAVRFVLPSQNGRRVHTDVITHSTPFFPVRTGEGFLELLGALGANAAPDAPKNPSPIEKYLGENPAALAFVTAPKPNPTSFATENYFGVNAFKLIAADGTTSWVRWRITPDAGASHLSDEEAKAKDAAYLHNEIQTRIIDGGASFTLSAQVANEGDQTNDATVRWPDDRRIVKLGTIKLESVSEDNDEKQRTIIFDPVPRDVEGVETGDDPLIDVRAALYLISGRDRRAAGPHH